MLRRMQCPSCSEEIDEGVAICPHCDAVVPAEKTVNQRRSGITVRTP